MSAVGQATANRLKKNEGRVSRKEFRIPANVFVQLVLNQLGVETT